ncbi:MAG: hypothetical protein ACPG4K_10415, partial [Haloferula sp.]
MTHLSLVKDKYVLRSIIQTCTESISEAYDNPEDTAVLLDRVEQEVLGIRQGRETTKGFDIKHEVSEVIKQFQQLLAGELETQG